jgi:hypothetical protein
VKADYISLQQTKFEVKMGNSVSYNSIYVAVNATTPGSEAKTAWNCVVMEPTGGLQLCAKAWTLDGKIYAATGLLDDSPDPIDVTVFNGNGTGNIMRFKPGQVTIFSSISNSGKNSTKSIFIDKLNPIGGFTDIAFGGEFLYADNVAYLFDGKGHVTVGLTGTSGTTAAPTPEPTYYPTSNPASAHDSFQ